MYSDANNLYGWAMSQKLTVNNFEWVENIHQKLIKIYDENSDKGYIIEVDVEYPKHLHDLHNNLPFLPERMKIKNCNKLVCSFYDKNNYAVSGKNMENVRKHRDIKLVTINRRKKYLVSEPNYYTKKRLNV